MNKPLIIGIGNIDRGDDAAGILTAEEVQHCMKHKVEVVIHNGEPASLIELWQNHQTVILIDAIAAGTHPGEILMLNLRETSLPECLFSRRSTHDFGIPEAVELARVMGKLPTQLLFYGIEASSFSMGQELSEVVKKAIPKVVELISERVSHA